MSAPENLVEDGRDVAHRLAKAGANVAEVIGTLSDAEISALEAFRAHQLNALVAQVEASDAGATIRWAAAKATYRASLAEHMGVTAEAILKEG